MVKKCNSIVSYDINTPTMCSQRTASTNKFENYSKSIIHYRRFYSFLSHICLSTIIYIWLPNIDIFSREHTRKLRK
jgi:hypothetical protein